jgi:hypothetical protein
VRIVPVCKAIADLFVVQKHYSRRASIFWAGFGLEEDGHITGVVVYGQPSPAVQKHAFRERDFRFYELARLVVQSKTKNAASFLIGGSLRLLPEQPCAVVSYADTEHFHCGIVYQATNWVYTGATKSHDKAYLVDGVRTHPMTLRDRGITSPAAWAKENGIQTVPPMPKHRYFQFVGNKRQVKSMRGRLVYEQLMQYPKCQKQRYDDGPCLVVPST